MTSTNYSSDTPVASKENDRFTRWNFSERVAQVIAKRTDPSCITIGLYGAWGDGKTSVLNFIRNFEPILSGQITHRPLNIEVFFCFLAEFDKVVKIL